MLNSGLVRPLDNARALRLVLAWTTGDNVGFHATLKEMQQDDAENVATATLLAAISIAAESIVAVRPTDYAETLQTAILRMVMETDSAPDRGA